VDADTRSRSGSLPFASRGWRLGIRKHGAMLRSLSFSRRRSRPPKSQAASTADRAADATVEEGTLAATAPLKQLKGRVLKRHHRNGWGTRWLELDDDTGVLYVYKTELDSQRKTPSHLYLLSEMEAVREAQSTAASHCFEVELRRPSLTLFYSCESRWIQSEWIRGMQARCHLHPLQRWKDGRGARLLCLDMPHPVSQFSAYMVRLANRTDEPIGVLIEDLAQASPLSVAGLTIGDVVLAVDGQACLSRTHAESMLVTASLLLAAPDQPYRQQLELIVYSPPLPNETPPASSVRDDLPLRRGS